MFEQVKKQVADRFNVLKKSGEPLFYVEVDKDKIWQIYLDAFDPAKRQENTCNCCKSFLRQFSGIVGIDSKHKLRTMWDIESQDPEYTDAVKAVQAYILSLPIAGRYYNTFAKCGTDKNLDGKKAPPVQWQHYYIELPQDVVKSDVGPITGESRDLKSLLLRGFKEITDEALDSVIELATSGSMYRGAEFLPTLNAFKKAKEEFKLVTGTTEQENFCWLKSTKLSAAVCRIKNSAVGTFLENLSEGKMDLDGALRAYEHVVAPASYKRPVAAVTPKMIEAAKQRLTELGMLDSLERRHLCSTDVSINNVIFVHRQTSAIGDIFDEAKKGVLVNPKSLSKVDEIGIEDFINKVVPTAKSLRVLVENRHESNFISLVGPQNPAAPAMFKWDNSFSWSYTGEVADSIKERVKAAGGNVTGFIRVSLSWHNHDDLDLHIREPGAGGHRGGEISFSNKRGLTGGILDVDMNAGCGTTREPVENICWAQPPTQDGKYEIVVNQFSRRESSNSGFEVEIEHDGEVHNFEFPQNGASQANTMVATFSYTKKDGFKIIATNGKSSGTNAKGYPSRTKWNIPTGSFHKVKLLTLSPNHWTKPTGNKHYVFCLEECKADDKVRGFYNEFLTEELSKDRKVFELLGSKVVVASTPDELSGLGFSDTVRNSIYVEVEGTIKRTLKVNF